MPSELLAGGIGLCSVYTVQRSLWCTVSVYVQPTVGYQRSLKRISDDARLPRLDGPNWRFHRVAGLQERARALQCMSHEQHKAISSTVWTLDAALDKLVRWAKTRSSPAGQSQAAPNKLLPDKRSRSASISSFLCPDFKVHARLLPFAWVPRERKTEKVKSDSPLGSSSCGVANGHRYPILYE